jgi:hypothetical protein
MSQSTCYTRSHQDDISKPTAKCVFILAGKFTFDGIQRSNPPYYFDSIWGRQLQNYLLIVTMDSILNEEGGYSDDLFIASHSEGLDCGICFNVMKDPVKACVDGGDHFYCRSCLGKHLQINQKSCPACLARISTRKPLQSARVLNNVISDLPVRCFTSVVNPSTYVL